MTMERSEFDAEVLTGDGKQADAFWMQLVDYSFIDGSEFFGSVCFSLPHSKNPHF